MVGVVIIGVVRQRRRIVLIADAAPFDDFGNGGIERGLIRQIIAIARRRRRLDGDEFGAMGLEGAIKLAYRKEMAAIEDPAARKAWFDDMVAKSYEENKALSSATFLEVDDVIDPCETRRWIIRGLKSVPRPKRTSDRKVTRVDLW